MRSLLFLVAAFGIAAPAIAQKDAQGSADHPLISRYPDSVIKWYDHQEFNRYRIAVGPSTGYRHIDDWLDVEGEVTRIYYELEGTRSVSEVFLNYVNALKRGGFEILAEGLFPASSRVPEIGSRSWLGIAYAENPLPTNGKIFLLAGSATSAGSGYVAGRLRTPQGDVYVSIGATQYSQERVTMQVDIIQEQAMDDGLVEVDAEWLFSEIERTGHVAVYGIHFAVDSADIQPASEPALREMARLLSENPELRVFVVGHTDMTGGLEHNMRLSAERARSVAEALVGRFGVAAGRLEAHGVGPLVPVASNGDEAGRKLNRRVDLVER